MHYRQWRGDEIQAETGKRNSSEEDRGNGQGMNGGTNVMDKPGKRKLFGSHPSPHGIPAFQHQHRQTPALQGDRSGKSVGPRTDHYGVIIALVHGKILLVDFMAGSVLSFPPRAAFRAVEVKY